MSNARELTEYEPFPGTFATAISTGSTLLDLAISGGVKESGGIPTGILAEIYGPSGSGKTVLISELAGSLQREGGQVLFGDPEGRLNSQFAKLFGLDTKATEYIMPDTVKQLFGAVRAWEPEGEGPHGIFADSLAALATEMEMENGGKKDPYRTSRSRDISAELRLTCRELKHKNYLMVCSNQVRMNMDGNPYTPKHITTGGMAVQFHSSIRLRTGSVSKIKASVKMKGKDVERVVGIDLKVMVEKNSVDKPYRSAPLTILFDYGIDDVVENLRFIKGMRGLTVYQIGETKLNRSLAKSIDIVEDDNLENALKEETIALWHEIEGGFDSGRKPKQR